MLFAKPRRKKTVEIIKINYQWQVTAMKNVNSAVLEKVTTRGETLCFVVEF